jgi:hypothetical protein
MARRAGSADLPLHSGHVPQWLASRMTRLGTVMTQVIVPSTGAMTCSGDLPSRDIAPIVFHRSLPFTQSGTLALNDDTRRGCRWLGVFQRRLPRGLEGPFNEWT